MAETKRTSRFAIGLVNGASVTPQLIADLFNAHPYTYSGIGEQPEATYADGTPRETVATIAAKVQRQFDQYPGSRQRVITFTYDHKAREESPKKLSYNLRLDLPDTK